MSRLAKATLASSLVLSVGIIYTVHYMPRQEADVRVRQFTGSDTPDDVPKHKSMFKGVLRDDERRRDKMRKREEELAESQRKRAIYEAVQQVPSHAQTDNS